MSKSQRRWSRHEDSILEIEVQAQLEGDQHTSNEVF